MFEELMYFIKERHSIYLKRSRGLPKPWTDDKIFQSYKFCNVYRELDRVTIWIRENIRDQYWDNPNLWFMLCIARQINWPETIEELMVDKKGAWPTKDTWNWLRASNIMDERSSSGKKLYTGAYMLTCVWPRDYTGSKNKSVFTCGHVLAPLWKDRKKIESQLHGSLREAHESLMGYIGWGSFLSAQVIADLKYTHYLEKAPDYWTWAASGPGSRRGLSRVLKLPITHNWDETEWLDELQELSKKVAPCIKKLDMPRLHNQDLQNCLCEFDKYQRVKLGEGRPRSTYPGV